MTQKILITGMSGLIGRVTREHLADNYQLSALNRSHVPGVTCFQADLADFEAIRPAFEGQDVVVHLAAKAGSQYTWDELRDTNIAGTYNVYEAAHRAGVKRIIFASSGAATSGVEQKEPLKALVEGRYNDLPDLWPIVTHQTPPHPGGIYGATKVWGEVLGRHYADTTGMSVICLRIGRVNPENRPTNPRDFSVWCSQRDIATMIEKCIEAPVDLHYDIFYVVSNNKWSYRDMTHPREVLGFEPQDSAESYR